MAVTSFIAVNIVLLHPITILYNAVVHSINHVGKPIENKISVRSKTI